MRPAVLLLFVLSATSASASWFGSDTPQYNDWSSTDLKKWLKDHNINVPEKSSQQQLKDLVQSNWNYASSWTADQYASAQKAFADMRESTFDTWEESRLREFLLEQGIVAPSGPREQLVLLAKNHYAAYTSAASSISAQASTAVYGDTQYQMSKSASSVVAQATREAARQLDDTKDYVYSTWDDNRLRSYLVEKGVIASTADKKRNELLALMRDAYARVTTPMWEAWSDSYMREWLIAHDLYPASAPPPTSDILTSKMSQYYYDTTSSVWSTWSDSDLKAWLVAHNIVKSDAQIQRDKLVKLLEDNYTNAKDTVWEAWSDTQMREWLVKHGEKTVPAKRDELVKMMQKKYHEADDAVGASYLTWPDARLRAYLRNRGIDESALPTSRPGLLQETRIRWVQTQTRWQQIRDYVNSGVEATEETLGRLVEMITGAGHDAKADAEKGAEKAKIKAEKDAKTVKEKVKGEL
ncbi:hypothetical protein MSAN_00566600 [Mycena sanguinolenta]|uniref:Meiotic sister chromatid recombination protein 1 n=1 Tax=Mycena sanguinolenta TaxID=230812 RepID=A0A8H6Z9R3_9AGAR|nr:hypothetical protein MSAN_00566600 [Mycena sanguinolenta]